MPNTTVFDKTPLLTTQRLTMHSFTEADLEDAVDILCNSEIKKTYMLPDFASREDAVRLFENLKSRSTSKNRFIYGIYLGETLIGFLNDVEADGHTIEVGYLIHPSVQNHGYATEALSAAVQELFRLGYSVVKAGFFEGNHASRRVMEKSGMKMIEQTDDIEYRGKVHHCIYYAISR